MAIITFEEFKDCCATLGLTKERGFCFYSTEGGFPPFTARRPAETRDSRPDRITELSYSSRAFYGCEPTWQIDCYLSDVHYYYSGPTVAYCLANLRIHSEASLERRRKADDLVKQWITAVEQGDK